MEPIKQRELLDHYQRDFPLEPRPYARIAEQLGCTETEVLAALKAFQDDGTVSRVGAVMRPNTIAASTLAAMAVPESQLEDIAAFVSAMPEVNHNYEREHVLNLWFVVVAADREAVASVLTRIAEGTGLEVVDLPLLSDYRIDLGFSLQ